MGSPDGNAMDFAADFARVAPVPGWLTEDQARDLHAAARACGPGARIVEIGCHHGRSTLALALGTHNATVTAVDPFPAEWRYGGPDTERRFRANLAAAGVADRVDVRVATSAEVRAGWTDRVDLLHVDGKHDYWTVRDDLRWAHFLRDGGVLFVHDAYGSVGVTLGLLAAVLPARRLRYVGRTGSLARLEVATPSLLDRLRLLGPLPWFARNVVVKVLLRLRLRPMARLLGHEGREDPY